MIVGRETATIEPSMTISARPAASTPRAFQRCGSCEGSASAGGAGRAASDGATVDAGALRCEGLGVVMTRVYEAMPDPASTARSMPPRRPPDRRGAHVGWPGPLREEVP